MKLPTTLFEKIRIIYQVCELDEYARVNPAFTGAGCSKDPCYSLYCDDGIKSVEQCALKGLTGARNHYSGKRVVLYWPDIRKSLLTEKDLKQLQNFKAAQEKKKREIEKEKVED